MLTLLAISTTSIALAGASVLVCAGLLLLMRTRWGRSRPMNRYAIASLAAHALLLGMASLCRLGGPALPGDADAPPVRVRIVMKTAPAPPSETEPETESEIEEPQPEAAPSPKEPPVEIIAAEPANEPADEPTPSEPTEALAQPKPEAKDVPNPLEAIVQSNAPEQPTPSQSLGLAPIPKAQASVATKSGGAPASTAAMTPTPTAIDSFSPTEPAAAAVDSRRDPAEPSPWASVRPSAYPSRGERQQRRLAADQGGSQETLDAVAAGVDWLARAQRPDGLWDSQRWGGGKEQRVLDEPRGGAGKRAETGLTGLALLAMGGAGHTHLSGPYRDTVTRGLQALIDLQKRGGGNDGDLAGNASLYARTYCHSMATFALAEALATTGDDRLRPAVERAVGYLVRGQHRSTGGWRYRPGDRGDMSQMGWVVMALRSAEIGGVAVRPAVWSGIERFVKSVERGANGGLACYQPLGPTSATMTAEALYCRQILGVANRRPAAEAEAINLLIRQPPTGPTSQRPANLYYWYYATLGLHHHRASNAQAESVWREWNTAMQRAILPRQVTQGRNAGSWSPNTLWGGYGGRVYSTSLATMCLEVYYRYDPDQIGRDPWIAARESLRR